MWRVLLLQIPLLASLAAAGTTCATNQTDWYTQEVGETPCATYQRLRQICDSLYEVGDFSSAVPGDSCDGVTSQVHDCCCNSVAWSLSMLCFNCQKAGNSFADPNGIDAPVPGSYQLYLGSCRASAVNDSLPTNIQEAVCNERINIPPPLYSIFWSDGPWYYTYTREEVETQFAANPNANLSICPANGSTASSGSPSASGLPPSGAPNAVSSSPMTASTTPSHTSHRKSKANVGAIAGGSTAGALVLLAAVAAAFFVFLRRRRRTTVTPTNRAALLPTMTEQTDDRILVPYTVSPSPAAGPAKPVVARERPPPYSGGPSRPNSGASSSEPSSPDPLQGDPVPASRDSESPSPPPRNEGGRSGKRRGRR